MPIPHADKLIEKAKAGVKLNPVERRHCVTYLMATEPSLSNVALGELFQVSESMIRNDRKWVREEKARYIKEDDISLVIADIALNFERQIRDLEKAKLALGKTTKGLCSRTYVEICKSLFTMELSKTKALQDLGYYPKNLGVLTTQTFEFKATVGMMEGSPKPLIEQRSIDPHAFDVEFSAVDEGQDGMKLLASPVLEANAQDAIDVAADNT